LIVELVVPRNIVLLAWERFKIIVMIIGDVDSRIIATLFYFTIFAPFGIISRLMSDPLHLRNRQPDWAERAAVPSELEAAKRQG
jgi:hypothetical protein